MAKNKKNKIHQQEPLINRIGTKRFYEKFAPEFDKVSKWWEHNAEADLAYADTKLSELARELAPDEPILIGQAYDIFDDKEGGSA